MSKNKQTRQKQVKSSGESPLPPVGVAAAAERAGCQREAIDKFARHDILFLIGSAGTGKTFISVNLAMKAMAEGWSERVVVSRPAVECGGEKHGFMPGDLGPKMAMWLLPFQDVLRSLVGTAAEKTLAQFEVVPLAYIRGRTISKAVGILDEAQNATVPQLRAFLTRIGHQGKLVVCGDPNQSDIAGGGPHLTLIAEEMERRGLAGVVRFPDSAIVRHPLIAGIERLFDDMRKPR